MSRKQPNLDRKKGLYLKHVGIKGRGVFCRTAIRKGEVLEMTPAIVLNEKATDIVDKTILLNYTFIIGNISKRQQRAHGIKKYADASCMIMGLMSFCNHDDKPNAEILWEEIDGTVYYVLEAIRAIPPNTEICTVYGKHWFEDRR